LKDLKQISVIGLGLLGGSISLAISRSLPKVKVVGYTHRAATRRRARKLSIANKIMHDIKKSVFEADLVIIATPISTFEQVFLDIAKALPAGCIVTDVGSTKVLSHRWAAKRLPKRVRYVGSHPVAGSEQRGVRFAKADLFERATCILTTTAETDRQAVQTVKRFWSHLGCSVKMMRPDEHDRIFANISHVPHVVAAALINANSEEDFKYAGTGFIDTSRIASGPSNIWTDILLTNNKNTIKGIDRIIAELSKLKRAINNQNKRQIEFLLEAARNKRAGLIRYKVRRKELLP